MARRIPKFVAVFAAVILPMFSQTSTGGATLGPAFVLETAGSLTSDPAEVIDGKQSIKGSYSGTASFTPYLRTDATRLLLAPGRTYRATFRYKILVTPDRGFEVLFFSPVGGAAGSFLPSIALTARRGAPAQAR
jgi:hypothetical protein